ncbi:phosphoethanolamine N-methyltransferase 1 [Lingula anatina]|uniref:phosphoethanolamine N-methyltransferase n=1 Tax=Lingula anatina TaxID=7574 RepID=A0A1S3IGP5_LINAN|nr:phosphoethanolamine N-methyltransferase 1 [Lingula anatina]|eukprot:XP_013397036.1 phosphoethanolamine N-methyltransferase 1 [Lingula anatina]
MTDPAAEDAKRIKTMKLYSHVDRVYNELKELGYGLTDQLKVEDLSRVDQYHYFGTQAVQEAIDDLKINSSFRILDIGSGIGGPARYIAQKTGCHITAVELQEDLNTVATDLTKRCNLQDNITHVCGDFLQADYGSESFDLIVSWLTYLHIPDKEKLFENCWYHLKKGGKMFAADFFESQPFDSAEIEKLSSAVYASDIPSKERYISLLESAGFKHIKFVDETEKWTDFVKSRHEEYVANKTRHVRVHNEEVYAEQEYFFCVVRKLFGGGHLGGCNVTADKV